jgi:hypothetical protein
MIFVNICISVRGVAPRLGITSFTRAAWVPVEPNATGLPSDLRYLKPMFIAPITFLSIVNLLLSFASLICIFITFTLLPPLSAMRVTEGVYLLIGLPLDGSLDGGYASDSSTTYNGLLLNVSTSFEAHHWWILCLRLFLLALLAILLLPLWTFPTTKTALYLLAISSIIPAVLYDIFFPLPL